MGAEGREPSGEDRSWKLGDRRSGRADAWGEFYTTAKRLHNKAQGRFGAPWGTSASRIPNREAVAQQSRRTRRRFVFLMILRRRER